MKGKEYYSERGDLLLSRSYLKKWMMLARLTLTLITLISGVMAFMEKEEDCIISCSKNEMCSFYKVPRQNIHPDLPVFAVP